MSKRRNYSKKKESNQKKDTLTVQVTGEQIKLLFDEMLHNCEWSTNKIIDEIGRRPPIVVRDVKKDTFSTVLRFVLAGLFFLFGVGLIGTVLHNWSHFWIGGANNIAVVCVLFVGAISCSCGVDLYHEKDRNYIVSLFSAIVSLVALVVVIIK